MLECVFCYSPSKNSYIFTECNHLACLECVDSRWDGKYSLRCCSKTTYLLEETIASLGYEQNGRSQLPVHYGREPVGECREGKENIEQSYCQKYQLEESVLAKSMGTQPQTMFLQVQDKKKQQNLQQMELALNQEVTKVKEVYESYRRQIERKQQMILKNLYNTYSDHLNAAQGSYTQNEVSLLKEKLTKVANQEPLNPPQVTSLAFHDDQKPDKILEKLDYNQQKMKEKLQKHYQLLK